MPEGNYYNAPARPDPATINVPRGYDGDAYLHEICKSGASARQIEEAVKAGADLDLANKNGMPPLGLAIIRGNVETVKALIDAGAKLYFEGDGLKKGQYFNAALLAADRGDKKMLETVLQKGGGAFVNLTGMDSTGYDDKFTALHAAVRKRNASVLGALVEAGAFLDAESGARRETPLMAAVAASDGEMIAKLVKLGASMEHAHSQTGETPLIFACKQGHRTGATKLLSLGADAKAADKDGRTALMAAAERGELSLVMEILKQNPDVNARSKNRETALMLGAKTGHTEIVKALLKAGADPLLTDAFNKSARAYAESAPSRGNGSYGRDSGRYGGGYSRYDDDGYHPRGGGYNGGYNDSINAASVIKTLETAEKEALQKQFEASYNRFRKNPSGPGA